MEFLELGLHDTNIKTMKIPYFTEYYEHTEIWLGGLQCTETWAIFA